VASGGLVHTKDNETLLIFRKGKWDLPKGKLDEGEDLEACALREIVEETGAANLKVEQPLYISYHTYHEKEAHILKESHWFLIKTNKKSILHPQTEEDIERCEWVPLDKLPGYMNNMHASIIDVVNAGIKLLTCKIS
jgi:8-oxo-dGTP pyrophosphatase MutT (NUDIX family)